MTPLRLERPEDAHAFVDAALASGAVGFVLVASGVETEDADAARVAVVGKTSAHDLAIAGALLLHWAYSKAMDLEP